MSRWMIVALIAVLLCPAPTVASAHLKAAAFAGREYHTGHSARPHKVKPRKHKSQRRQSKKAAAQQLGT